MLDFIQEAFARTWTDLLARPGGPMSFRFLLQPVMAAIVAIRDGRRDARRGRHQRRVSHAPAAPEQGKWKQ